MYIFTSASTAERTQDQRQGNLLAQQFSLEPRTEKSGDALAAAFELVATPALFAFFGWKIDDWLGTGPIFLLVLTILTASYSIYRLLAQYDREMAAHEEARIRAAQRKREES